MKIHTGPIAETYMKGMISVSPDSCIFPYKEKLSKSSGDSPPNPTCFSPEPGSSLAGSPSSPHGPRALEGAGPWAGGSDEDPHPRPWELGYRASRVGEFKESDDWSPLLLLLR